MWETAMCSPNPIIRTWIHVACLQDGHSILILVRTTCKLTLLPLPLRMHSDPKNLGRPCDLP